MVKKARTSWSKGGYEWVKRSVYKFVQKREACRVTAEYEEGVLEEMVVAVTRRVAEWGTVRSPFGS